MCSKQPDHTSPGATRWNILYVGVNEAASRNPECGKALLNLLNEFRRQRWTEAMESLDFTHLSDKAWSLLRHLAVALPPTNKTISISINVICCLKNAAGWKDLYGLPD